MIAIHAIRLRPNSHRISARTPWIPSRKSCRSSTISARKLAIAATWSVRRPRSSLRISAKPSFVAPAISSRTATRVSIVSTRCLPRSLCWRFPQSIAAGDDTPVMLALMPPPPPASCGYSPAGGAVMPSLGRSTASISAKQTAMKSQEARASISFAGGPYVSCTARISWPMKPHPIRYAPSRQKSRG